MRRHLVIPDCQVRPGVDTTHLDWAARAIVKFLPDVLVILGDFWDMPSLSTHEGAGSKESEGKRILADIEAGNTAFARLTGPMNAEIKRRKRRKIKQWSPECHFLFGNHEDRISRAVQREPKWDGFLSLDSLLTPGFTRHPFLKILEVDGIKYCHYFPNPFSGKPIGGTIHNRLSHIGSSFIQGHQQGFLYGSKQYPDHVKHGIVSGRFYMHDEHYRPPDVQHSEWSGIFVLNQVNNGDFDLMSMRASYLKERFGYN